MVDPQYPRIACAHFKSSYPDCSGWQTDASGDSRPDMSGGDMLSLECNRGI
jgi:hypothetical protein